MKYQIVQGGVKGYFVGEVAKGTGWDEMHVQNTELEQHQNDPDLVSVLVVAVPRAQAAEAREKIEAALQG